MKTIATILLAVSTTDAFAPPTSPSTTTSTALNHIDTRKRIEGQELGIWPTSCRDKSGTYVPCDAISGEEVRESWASYAPEHGSPSNYGAIGCPGGGDWCYASSYGAASPIPHGADMKKRAANVAAALAGLGSGVGGSTNSDGLSIGKGETAFAAPALVSAASDASVMGEDVRGARGSYAPYSHDGRVGTVGEIGASGDGGGPHTTQVATPSGRQVRRSVDYRTPSPKTYALGSWKK